MRPTILLLGAPSGAIGAQPTDAQDHVVVNGNEVTQEEYARELGRLGLPLPVVVPDGDYWYDRMSGLWGVRGGPTLGASSQATSPWAGSYPWTPQAVARESSSTAASCIRQRSCACSNSSATPSRVGTGSTP
jgi:hypothetical protein